MSRSRELANLAGDATGLETLTVSDITDLTSTATELNKLDGVTSTTTELNYVDVTLGTVTASKAVTADSNTDIALGASGKLKLGSSGGIYESDGSTAILTESSGAVTLENVALGSTVTGGIPSGMIAPMGMSSAPTGWLACDGTAVSRTTYAALFSAIGTTWGAGNGSSTFNVPDLRGAWLRGTGTAGVSGDYVGPSVGAYQDDQNASHSHSASTSVSVSGVGDHSHGNRWSSGAGGYNYPESPYVGNNNSGAMANTQGAGSHSHSASGSTSIGSEGGTEARVYNRGVQYCIKI